MLWWLLQISDEWGVAVVFSKNQLKSPQQDEFPPPPGSVLNLSLLGLAGARSSDAVVYCGIFPYGATPSAIDIGADFTAHDNVLTTFRTEPKF